MQLDVKHFVNGVYIGVAAAGAGVSVFEGAGRREGRGKVA